MSPWILAARPKTLTAGIVPVVLGSALAYRDGIFSWAIFLSALLGSLAIQIGTNYVNDAADFQKGADDENRLGPPRMAASGKLSVRALYWGAALSFLASVLFGAYLIYLAGPWILAIGLFSIFFAVIYTAGPFPLAYLGLGDLFVFIFFGLVALNGTYFSQTNEIGKSSLLLSIVVGLQGMALIAVNNLRDIPTDVKVSKRTLAVRMGDRLSRYYYCLLTILPFLFWLMAFGANTWGYLPMLALPLALWNCTVCLSVDNRLLFNVLLARSAALQMLFGVLATISLIGMK